MDERAGKHGDRHVVRSRREEHDEREHEGSGEDHGYARHGAGIENDRRPREGTGRREAADERGADVAQPLAYELPARAERVTYAGSEQLSDGDGFHRANHRDGQCRPEQPEDVGKAQHGHDEVRDFPRDRLNVFHELQSGPGREVRYDAHDHDRDERCRKSAAGPRLQPEQHAHKHERRGAERERDPVRTGQRRHRPDEIEEAILRRHPAPERLDHGGLLEPQDGRQLVDRDVEPGTGGEPRQHGFAHESREAPEAECRADELDDPGEERDDDDLFDSVSADGMHRERGAQHDRNGIGGAVDEELGTAERRPENRRHDGGRDADRGRKPGDERVGHRLRNREQRDRQTRDEITPRDRRGVVPEDGQQREPPFEAVPPHLGGSKGHPGA